MMSKYEFYTKIPFNIPNPFEKILTVFLRDLYVQNVVEILET